MDIKNKLSNIVMYYDVTRQVGHTSSTLEGAFNSDCIFLTHNVEFAKHLEDKYKLCCHKIQFQSIGSKHALVGHKKPIIFDNSALHMLFKESLDQMVKDELEIRKLRHKIEELNGELRK